MRAVLCREFGAPQKLVLVEREAPVPGPDEVAVSLHSWGVNFVDVLMVAGGYQLRPELPFIPGLEAAGTVSTVGAQVSEYSVGDRVIVGMRPGAFAEQVAVPSRALLRIPDSMSFEQAACFRSAFSTAYHGLAQGGRLRAGETALVHGATGGMGLAAVQVAKQLGATVIATGGDERKLQTVLEYGADHVVCYRKPRFREQVRALTGGVDVVFDPVGGEIFEESMHCLNWGARLVIVGFTSGRAARARTNHLLIKGASAIGVRAGEFGRRNPQTAHRNLATLLAWAERGLIRSHVSHRFRLDQVAEAMQAILDREVIGRVVMQRD